MSREELLKMQTACTMLFQASPYTVGTAAWIGKKLGKEEEELYPVLDALVQQGILQVMESAITPLYRYNEPLVITEFNDKETENL